MQLVRPAATEGTQTLNAKVFAQIHSDIITCRLMPNERLRLERLRTRYGAGGSPIREALMRLQAEGLVELEQNKGFRVSDVSRERLLDLMRTRMEIEGVALRWSIDMGSVEWEASLLAAFHRLARQTKIDPSDPDTISEAWVKEHQAFHASLVSACGSPTLLAIRTRLFEQTERYVALSIMFKVMPRNDVAEHKYLMQAVLNRDLRRAIALNREHIERTREKVLTSLARRNPPIALAARRKELP